MLDTSDRRSLRMSKKTPRVTSRALERALISLRSVRWKFLPRELRLTLPLKVNRNKKSIGLSFQHPEGVKILHELAKTSDVLVENYIPGAALASNTPLPCVELIESVSKLTSYSGALKKYQLDYESMRKINPS